MKMNLIKIFSILFLALFSIQANSAEVIYNPETKKAALWGKIVVGDYAKVRKVLEGKTVDYLVLNSGGGNFFEGLYINSFVVFSGIKTMVPPDMQCVSACAFIWMGGKERVVYKTSKVGFHAPYRRDTLKSSPFSDRSLSWLIGFNRLNIRMVEDITKSGQKMIYLNPEKAVRWNMKYTEVR